MLTLCHISSFKISPIFTKYESLKTVIIHGQADDLQVVGCEIWNWENLVTADPESLKTVIDYEAQANKQQILTYGSGLESALELPIDKPR